VRSGDGETLALKLLEFLGDSMVKCEIVVVLVAGDDLVGVEEAVL
jgi:hypothetical protein